MKSNQKLPQLPLEEWEKSKITLHLFLQIVGKIKLALMPPKNHWWNITFRVSSKGLTTGPIPYQNGQGNFTIEFDLLKHLVQINSSNGGVRKFEIMYGLTVSKFYSLLLDNLQQLNISVNLKNPYPYDMGVEGEFTSLTKHYHYDANYVQKYYRVLLWVDNIFKDFECKYKGKSSPVHLFWHSLDLVVTRFSGKKADNSMMSRTSDREAYSHENISFGFWAGDKNHREPAFYSYTWPSPEGLDSYPIKPAEAKWIDNNGSPMALLNYQDLINKPDPEKTLKEFLHSAYQAGITSAGWETESF
ncbi:hypothetical protein KI659_15550 [Litoribacter alkaliphilus]|uniref:Ava_C0101 and related proteins n=1 Tax=Litoribacter ruber TaxID=702568 RepID=A0AAP2CPB6_9BACT|nr:DUF5996 family protein [Litoribacter alkaliphilus]MBS9525432.1 hypothetical protein [Litoribacter alkaliphilus]